MTAPKRTRSRRVSVVVWLFCGVVVLIFATLLLPALKPAKSNTGRSGSRCKAHLKQLVLAYRIKQMEGDSKFPDSFSDLRRELDDPRNLFCPADTSKPVIRLWEEVRPDNITYKFATKGVPLSDTNTPLFHCPIHNRFAYADGRIEQRDSADGREAPLLISKPAWPR